MDEWLDELLVLPKRRPLDWMYISVPRPFSTLIIDSGTFAHPASAQEIGWRSEVPDPSDQNLG